MIIEKYIKNLLQERRRVILPGFGNLEVKFPDKNRVPTGNRIDPPGLAVRFDAGYSKDDGGLAEAVAEGEGLENEEARQRVLELVDTIRFVLNKGEDYIIPETGTFIKDEDGKVHFQIDPSWVLAPDLFGLESMDLLELEDVPEEEEADNGSKHQTGAQRRITPLATPAPKAKTKRWRVIWLVTLALIVVLVVLIVVPSGRNGDESNRKGLFRKRPDREVIQQEEITTDSQEGQEGQEGEIQEGEIPEGDQAAEPETEITVPEQNAAQPASGEEVKKYFIIAGSFGSLRNASDLQDKLNERGYQAEVLITENRLYRVSVGSFATKEEAEKRLSEITTEPDLQSCWLLSN